MSEKCEITPGRECHNSTRLALLEKRVDDLETGQSRDDTSIRIFVSFVTTAAFEP